MPMPPLLDELQTRSNIAVTCHVCVFLLEGVCSLLCHVLGIHEECRRLLWRTSVALVFSCLRSGCVFWTRGPQSSAHLSTRKGKCARLVLVCWWEVQFLIEVGQALSVWSCSFHFCTKQASCNKAL